MRDPQDTSTGGELELYKFKKGKPYGFRNFQIPNKKYVECVKKIKYEQNVLVLFLNSVAVHGVTVRSLTDYPRYFVNFVGEVKKPWFDISKFQDSSFTRKKILRQYSRKIKNSLQDFVKQGF